jgi:hypothetical protein
MRFPIDFPFQAQAIFYQSRPVLALAIEEGLSSLGMVKARPSHLEEFGSIFGLRPVDRYLRPLTPGTQCDIVLTDRAVYVEINGSAVPRSHAEYQAAWHEAVVREGSVVLLILRGDLLGEDAAATIRSAAGTRRCVGGIVDILDASGMSLPREGRYRLLGTSLTEASVVPSQTSFVLDSNVVRDLEAAAQGRMTPKHPNFKEVQGLMVELIHQDVIPGLGIEELTWSPRDRSYNHERRASLRAAIDTWFDHGMEGVLEATDLRERWEIHFQAAQRRAPVEFGDPGSLLLETYAGLLKMDELWSQVHGFKAAQRVALMGEFCRFMSADLSLVSGYTLKIAFDLLIGQPDETRYIRKLLKFSEKRRLADLLGAAWDILFLRVPEYAAAGLKVVRIPPGNGVVLVTADRAMANLRDRIGLKGLVLMGTASLGFMGAIGDINPALEAHRTTIEEMIESLNAGAQARLGVARDSTSSQRLEGWVALLEDNVRRRATCLEDGDSKISGTPSHPQPGRGPRWSLRGWRSREAKVES